MPPRGKPAPKSKAAVKASGVLQPKDAQLLSQVFEFYEKKEYRKAIKSADLVLKKSPDHAQTLCMKGIATYYLGTEIDREQGRELAKKGLAVDVKSHVCWHVNALLHRADKNYHQAMACYKQSHHLDPNDLNVLRDLLNLQLYLRDFEGALKSRLSLFRVTPKTRTSWIGLAVAYHLAGDHTNAADVLSQFQNTLASKPSHDFDNSEVALFRAEVHLEAGEAEAALAILEKEARTIVDRRALSELQARCFGALEQHKREELTWNELVESNEDCLEYIHQYARCKGLPLDNIASEKQADTLAFLKDLSIRFPRSTVIRRLALSVADGDQFRKLVDRYLINGLSKGIPSLFNDIKSLYTSTEKQAIVEDLMQSYKTSLESGKPISEDMGESTEEAPTTLIWVLYFLALHYSFTSRQQEALESIDAALAHTPSLPDLVMAKARILKRMGAEIEAYKVMEGARRLDGQDRFLNGKTVKYALRVGFNEEAVKTAGMFIRKDATSPEADLIDMQCFWFLTEQAESFARENNTGMALKRYHNIERIFQEIHDDEMDFSGYCMRKFTLRSYMQLVQFENQLYARPVFLRAAEGAINIYLDLHDNPKKLTNGNGTAINGIEDEEARKAEKKAKKAEAKAAAAAAEAKSKSKKDDDVKVEEVDQDPHGHALATTDAPLEGALKFVRLLENGAKDRIETWLFSFEVHLRRGKLLLALSALTKAHSLDPSHPKIHEQILALHQASHLEALKALHSSALPALAKLLATHQDLESYRSSWVQSYAVSGKPDAVLAAANGLSRLKGSESQSEVEGMLFSLVRPDFSADLASCLKAFKKITQISPSKVDDFRAQALAKYPRCDHFQAGDLKAQKEELRNYLNASMEDAEKLDAKDGVEILEVV